MYVGKTVLRSDILVKPGKMEGPPLGDLGGPLCRQRALQMQRLGGGSEFRTEQRPLWLSSEADVEGVGGRRDGRDQPDHDLLGHGKEFRFYSPWASEPLEGFE